MTHHLMAKQRGVTLLGFLFGLIIAGIFAFIAMRLFPVYTEFMSVKSDMQEIADTPGSASLGLADVRKSLEKRFYISYVESVNLKDNVTLTKVGNVNQLKIAYEVRRPMAYNLDFVAKFEHMVELNK